MAALPSPEHLKLKAIDIPRSAGRRKIVLQAFDFEAINVKRVETTLIFNLFNHLIVIGDSDLFLAEYSRHFPVVLRQLGFGNDNMGVKNKAL